MKLNFTCSFYTVLIGIALIYEIISKYMFNTTINVTELWIFFILLVLVDILAELRRK